MPHAQLDSGIRLHYRDCGEGKPLLFIPGLSATLETWNYQVGELSDRYRCVSVDLRGHGDSDKPVSDYTYDEMCGDIDDLMTQLGLEGVTLVGWSMGAGVALQYVLDHNDLGRVSRLVLVGAAAPRFRQTDTEPYGMDEESAAASLEGLRTALPETMAAFSGANFHRTDLEATREWFLSEWLKMPSYVGYRYFNTLLTVDLRDRLREVAVPTLLVHGRHDQVADPRWAEYMAERIADSKLVWLEESGHASMVEQPHELAAEIASFVQ